MLKTGLRSEIPSELSEIADRTLISGYYKKYSRKKKRGMDARYSTRNPDPVKTERDSRSYTNFKISTKTKIRKKQKTDAHYSTRKIQIPSTLSEVADPTLLSRYFPVYLFQG